MENNIQFRLKVIETGSNFGIIPTTNNFNSNNKCYYINDTILKQYINIDNFNFAKRKSNSDENVIYFQTFEDARYFIKENAKIFPRNWSYIEISKYFVAEKIVYILESIYLNENRPDFEITKKPSNKKKLSTNYINDDKTDED